MCGKFFFYPGAAVAAPRPPNCGRVSPYIYLHTTYWKINDFQQSFSAIQIDFSKVFMALYERARRVVHDRGVIFENRSKNDKNMASESLAFFEKLRL